MRAFITGATGQDGFYLAKELREHGYDVFGLYQGQDEKRLASLSAELPYVAWIRGDVTDPTSMDYAVQDSKPDVVFNLAARSFVGTSWQMPRAYMDTNCGGLINVLEAVRRYAPEAHVVQASTSEMFGNVGGLLSEESPMKPVSPYGVSKLAAHRMCAVYRESYGMKVTSAISFNHESPRRPPLFVTRKVTMAAARFHAGQPHGLTLGNTQARRDWGHAADYMRAYRLMAEQNNGDDFVVATGRTHSIADLVCAAFGSAIVEIGRDQSLMRPNELNTLTGHSGKLRTLLGWIPEHTFEDLIEEMVQADMAALREAVPA